MNRKHFIKSCSIGCLSAVIAPAILQSCRGTKYIDAPIEGADLVIPVAAFEIPDKVAQYRKYLVVQNEALEYPICVYRLAPDTYQALLMRCTHQGTELHVFGDSLQCPAHGSEFTNKGTVQHGPAADNLRTFAIAVGEKSLKISLR